jgi:hypothetical protein
MFIKHGDDTKSFSVEKTGTKCESCLQPIVKIDGQPECGCSNNKFFNKSKEILTQQDISTNFQENKRVDNV